VSGLLFRHFRFPKRLRHERFLAGGGGAFNLPSASARLPPSPEAMARQDGATRRLEKILAALHLCAGNVPMFAAPFGHCPAFAWPLSLCSGGKTWLPPAGRDGSPNRPWRARRARPTSFFQPLENPSEKVPMFGKLLGRGSASFQCLEKGFLFPFLIRVHCHFVAPHSWSPARLRLG